MLLAIDVGNTAVTYGIYKGKKLVLFGSTLFNDFPKILNKWSKSGDISFKYILISSVVPKNTLTLKKLFSKMRPLTVLVAGENIRVPIKHHYSSIRKLGSDRIVNIYGALKLYPPPLLIIDYGTAVTFDYVSRRKVFEGGMIIPGPEISFQALIDKAALLPKKIRLPKKTSSFLGRNTFDCLRSGVLEGFGALTDDLVERFKSIYGKNLRVIATGGFAEYLKPYVNSFDVLDPRHSIKSLFVIFNDLFLNSKSLHKLSFPASKAYFHL